MSMPARAVSGLDRKIAAFAQKIRLFGLVQAVRYYFAKVRRERTLRLPVEGVMHPVRFRMEGSDLYHLWAILGREEMAFTPSSTPAAIVDAGAHIGLASVFLANRFPTARILAVEPSPANLPLLRENLDPYPGTTVLDGALWPTSGWIRIANPDDDPDAFRVELSAPGRDGAIAAYSPADLFGILGAPRISLFKIDVEGAERDLFTADTSWLERVDALVIELHDRFRPGCEDAVRAKLPSPAWRCRRRGEYLIFQRGALRPG